MKIKPTVLIIENSVSVTGALKSIVQSSYDLRNHYQFQFIVPNESKGKEWIREKGFTNIHEFPLKELQKSLPALIRYLPYLLINAVKLNRLLKNEKISIIHVNDVYNLLPVMAKMLGARTPYVCHIRFLPNKFPRLLFDFWFNLHSRYSSGIVAVSEAVKKMLPRNENVEVIYNELPEREIYSTLNLQTKTPPYRYLYLSNFISGKGHTFALEAFSRVHKDLPDWKMKFVGGDMGLKKNREYMTGLQEQAKMLNISSKLEWGQLTKDVELEYKQADIVLNFSESESFSLTCLEALFYGLPLIASDCGGPSEIIEHEKSGFIVGNRDVKSMSAAMKRLALNNDLRHQMGSHGRKSVREKFSTTNTSMRLKLLYERALQR